jgi:hypothetical protein
MRGSLHGRLLVEMALAKVTQLENLTALGPLVDRLAALESGAPRGPRADVSVPRRKRDPSETAAVSASASAGPASVLAAPAPSSPTPISAAPLSRPQVAASVEATPMAADMASAGMPPQQPASTLAPGAAGPGQSPAASDVELPALNMEMALKFWPTVVNKAPAKLQWRLIQVEPVAVIEPDVLVIAAKPEANSQSVEDDCGTPDVLGQFEKVLQKLIHRPVKIKYERTTAPEGASVDSRPADSRRPDAVRSDPIVQKVVELFGPGTLQLEYEDADPTL